MRVAVPSNRAAVQCLLHAAGAAAAADGGGALRRDAFLRAASSVCRSEAPVEAAAGLAGPRSAHRKRSGPALPALPPFVGAGSARLLGGMGTAGAALASVRARALLPDEAGALVERVRAVCAAMDSEGLLAAAGPARRGAPYVRGPLPVLFTKLGTVSGAHDHTYALLTRLARHLQSALVADPARPPVRVAPSVLALRVALDPFPPCGPRSGSGAASGDRCVQALDAALFEGQRDAPWSPEALAEAALVALDAEATPVAREKGADGSCGGGAGSLVTARLVHLHWTTYDRFFGLLLRLTGPASFVERFEECARVAGFDFRSDGLLTRRSEVGGGGGIVVPHSEGDLFAAVGLAYAEPHVRR